MNQRSSLVDLVRRPRTRRPAFHATHPDEPKERLSTFPLLPDELWWGGFVQDGIEMPFGVKSFERDLTSTAQHNQATPLLISNKGRAIWSDEPFRFVVEPGKLKVYSESILEFRGNGTGTLRSVFLESSRSHFPPTGMVPDLRLFTSPQYNLWIETMYEPTQEKVLDYARNVLAHGLPPGVIMIDDNWQEDYGDWRFESAKFPDPKAMVDKLHEMGFSVMLWICNFVSPDSEVFRALNGQHLLLREASGEIAIRNWWNGYSAVLDTTNPAAVAWLRDKLDSLILDIRVDGFKFDAGDFGAFRNTDICFQPTHANGHCEAWAKIGLSYPLNEYRACWKQAGQPLVQRLSDKRHSWERATGIGSLIPNGLAQGLMGYAFTCPDMIGGGEYISFLENSGDLDQELVVRSAQCAALFPMMQFSAAPWRILDDEHLKACIDAARIHVEFADEIERLAWEAAKTGEPIIRHMAYVFPDAGLERVDDQFMLGDDVLVAPVQTKGTYSRSVQFPPGKWHGDDGSHVEGPCVLVIDAPLSRLPYFRRA